MPSLRELQVAFARAVFGEGARRLDAEVVASGLAVARRLNIYRNNTLASLTDALAAVYPVIARLVGEEYFGQAAREYARHYPSTSGNLHDFGEAFPGFLSRLPEASGLPYLADVARLEWAYHACFHAPDHPPLDLPQLAQVAPERHGDLRFSLHPASRLLASEFPVLRIWAVNQDGAPEDATVDLGEGAARLLVIRRGLEVEIQPLTQGGWALLSALARAETLGAAAEAALAVESDFDLGGWLIDHVRRQTLVGFEV